jgi:hypothetical protein
MVVDDWAKSVSPYPFAGEPGLIGTLPPRTK